jgi:formate dehydrogenase alpha subunit
VTVAGLVTAFGSGAMTNSIGEMEHTEVFLVTGSNTTENHPIVALRIKKAVRERGAKLIVIDPREIELAKIAHIWLRPTPGTDVIWLNGLMNIILEENLWDRAYVKERTEGFAGLKEAVQKYTPEYVEKLTGIPQDELREVARVYASAEKAGIFYAMGITQHVTGTDNVRSIANLAMLCGNVGVESGGVNPLRGQNNVQGACDMGALPNVLSGYQSVTDPATIKKFEENWGVPLSSHPGLTVIEMMQGALEGNVKAMYIMGENPMVTDPDLTHVEEALKKLELLVVQDLFLTETAKLAHVVLPSASSAEKEGTFTNTERRVQRVRKALEPVGECKTDSEIITSLSKQLGYEMNYKDASEIMEEIAACTPLYGGIAYDRLEKEGLQWPCPSKDHPGIRYLHKDRFTRGRGLFQPVEYQSPAELPDAEYPFILSTGRILYHYHASSMSRRSEGLKDLSPEAHAEINPADAQKLGIEDGTLVRVTSRRGQVELKARITERSPVGVVFIHFHYSEVAVNTLMHLTLDPVGKIPEFKVCAVKVEKTKH